MKFDIDQLIPRLGTALAGKQVSSGLNMLMIHAHKTFLGLILGMERRRSIL